MPAEREGDVHAETPLWPFYKDGKKLWTSNDVKDWTTLGFAVPGHEPLNEGGRIELEKYVRENYYWYV